MKKKEIIFIVITIISLILSIGLNIYLIFFSRSPSPSEIFNANKLSVVELKATKESVGTSYGTAEIIDKNGTLVTNAHVVTYKNLGNYYAFDDISIRFANEEDYRSVSLIKYDLELDIAVLKLESNLTLTPIKIGNDKNLSSGDCIYAMGNLSNYGLSISSGIVSIPHIFVTYNDTTRNVIQCDLTISDGNSGGALLNSKGELVGLTTFRLKDNDNKIVYGIAYCVPICTVMEYIESN